MQNAQQSHNLWLVCADHNFQLNITSQKYDLFILDLWLFSSKKSLIDIMFLKPSIKLDKDSNNNNKLTVITNLSNCEKDLIIS